MTCQQVGARVRDHEEGRLPGPARWSLRLHLLMCVHCRRYFQQLRAVSSLLQAQPAEPPGPAVEDAALAAFRTGRRSSE
ncbi:MAG: hypothetical protein R3B06_01060 [Kofleriaceae bacterium]